MSPDPCDQATCDHTHDPEPAGWWAAEHDRQTEEAGEVVLVDGLRWRVVGPARPGSVVFRLELLEDDPALGIGHQGFACASQMVAVR